MQTLYELLGKPTALIDTHAHLNAEDFDADLETVIEHAKEHGVGEVWDVSTNLESTKKSLEISKSYQNVKSWIGVDPAVFIPGSDLFISLDADDAWFENIEKTLRQLTKEHSSIIIGLGETGLDYYYLENSSQLSTLGGQLTSQQVEKSKRLQEKLFRLHLEIAEDKDLPLTIHTRGAEEQCLEIIKEYKAKGIFHSFTGSLETAQAIIQSGNGLGINGIFTFKNAKEIRELYKNITQNLNLDEPADFFKAGLYFETDAPYLAPEGMRGKRNVPGNSKQIFEKAQRVLRG